MLSISFFISIVYIKDFSLASDWREIASINTIAVNIVNIKSESNGQYIYTIATNRRPFACDLTIGYTTKLPNWVITSNFENNSLPKDSTTYGIKSLIEGVNNAYQNKDNNIFTINLSLK